jgi:hypothetical protein
LAGFAFEIAIGDLLKMIEAGQSNLDQGRPRFLCFSARNAHLVQESGVAAGRTGLDEVA